MTGIGQLWEIFGEDDDTRRRFEAHINEQLKKAREEQPDHPMFRSAEPAGAMNFEPDEDEHTHFVEEQDTPIDWPKLEAVFTGNHVDAGDVQWEDLGVFSDRTQKNLIRCKRCLGIWSTPTGHWCNPNRNKENA